MSQSLERTDLDLRYESYRLKNRSAERTLLADIVQSGIREPLEGVQIEGVEVLLNGFKRYRIAKTLGLETVPYTRLGHEAALGILKLLQISNTKSLNLLEQASFVEELHKVYQMDTAQIAQSLSRSKSWVSMRLGLFAQMTSKVRKELFEGRFPVYAYMYTIRQFMRMKEESKESVEGFVCALSGQGLSVREIEQLAHAYFRGPAWLREHIHTGKLRLVLDKIKALPQGDEALSDFERKFHNDLERLHVLMKRLSAGHADARLKSKPFYAGAGLLAAGILSYLPTFKQSITSFYDRSQ